MRFFLVLIFSSCLLIGCKSMGKNANVYVQPEKEVPSVTFWGEDSPEKFLVKGHEKIYLCRVDGAFQNSYSFNKATRVALGKRKISICYREGLNSAEVSFDLAFDNTAQYQLKLGEHSNMLINFSVVNKQTNELFIGPISIPK